MSKTYNPSLERRRKQRIYDAEWKRKNPAFVKLRRRRMYEKHQQNVLRLKIEQGGECVQCGFGGEEQKIRILHFHHTGIKSFSVSANRRSYKSMKEEIKKCELLCPNCHALVHLKPLT